MATTREERLRGMRENLGQAEELERRAAEIRETARVCIDPAPHQGGAMSEERGKRLEACAEWLAGGGISSNAVAMQDAEAIRSLLADYREAKAEAKLLQQAGIEHMKRAERAEAENEALRAERDGGADYVDELESANDFLRTERDRLRKALVDLRGPIHALTYVVPPTQEAQLKWHDEAIATIDRALRDEHRSEG